MQSIECSICSEKFGNRGEESTNLICVTPCGHVYHQCCIMKWLSGSPSSTCPECRDIVNINDLRRIYFNFAPGWDNMQTYSQYLEQEMDKKALKFESMKREHLRLIADHKDAMGKKDDEISEIKMQTTNRLREKDDEIRKVKNELQKLKKSFRTQANSKLTDQYRSVTDQRNPLPVDMTSQNGIQQCMFYYQNQPSTSSTMRLNDSIPSATTVSAKPSTFTASNSGVLSSSMSHESRQSYPSIGDTTNATNSANLSMSSMFDSRFFNYPQHMDIYAANYASSMSQPVTNQPSMVTSNNYMTLRMPGVNNPTPSRNVNYQPSQSPHLISTNAPSNYNYL